MTAHSDGIDDEVRMLVAARLGVAVAEVTLETRVEIEIAPPGGGSDDPLLTELAKRFGTVFQHPVESRSAIGVVLREALVYPAVGCGLGLLWDPGARETGWGWRFVLLAGFVGFGALAWLSSKGARQSPGPFRRTATVRRLAAAVRNGMM